VHRSAATKNAPTSRASAAPKPAAPGMWPARRTHTAAYLRSITTPPTRKRQKKADSRVAELERKIDALTATLHAQKTGTPEIRHHGGIPQHEDHTHGLPMPEGSFRVGTLSHDWVRHIAHVSSYRPLIHPPRQIPPPIGTQTYRPATDRRRLQCKAHRPSGGSSMAAATLYVFPPACRMTTDADRRFRRTWMPSIATLPSIPR
jgi:hypothetical protein